MFRLLRTRRPRLLYMPGDGVDQMDSISERGQPAGVDARSATSVDDRGGSRREMAKNQFLRARVFQLKPSRAQTGGFVVIIAVESDDRIAGVFLGHDVGQERESTRGARYARCDVVS